VDRGEPSLSEDAEDGVPGADTSVDRVRVALDLLRERQAHGRPETTKTLHKARRHDTGAPESLLTVSVFGLF